MYDLTIQVLLLHFVFAGKLPHVYGNAMQFDQLPFPKQIPLFYKNTNPATAPVTTTIHGGIFQ